MRTGRPLLLVLGAVTALFGLGLLAAGVGATWVHTTARDADGYITSPTYELAADGVAITSERIELDARPTDWWPAPGDLPVRIRATAADEGGDVFVGIAAADDVERYLGDADRAAVARLGPTGSDVDYRTMTGSTSPAPPGEQDFWFASTAGTGTQELAVDPAPGDWQLVVMNADATPGVAVDASAGVRTAVLLPIGMGLLVGALVALFLAVTLLIGGAVTRPPTPSDEPVAPTGPPAPGRRVHPVAIEGRLDPSLSRGMWLVKWLLAIPHVVVLAFLYAAFVVLTVAAGFAILFTGRYPRPIFDLNLGILRWSWRVTYYAYGVLGTDRYPPFSLGAEPDYPATLDIPYPQELSRGLVLVKWWLLAIPHYIIIGVFTGGMFSWTVDIGAPEGAQVVAGTGLIGVLVLVAAIALLVTGRYPRGLYDLVLGLQRWVYRVVAYAALMTDDYPPFRLDTGGSEPPVPPSEPPSAPPSATGDDRREVTHA